MTSTADLPWLDGSQRGFPADRAAVTVANLERETLSVLDGSAQLPVLTFDRAAWSRNCDAMFAYADAAGARLAPHVKTPMSPELARELWDRGAVALTVADIRQAVVMLGYGLDRLILANQIGGRASGARLGRLLKAHPDARVTLYVDSLAALETAGAVADASGRTADFLIEVGGARAGARAMATVQAILKAMKGHPKLKVSGIAAYEGASATADQDETRRAIGALHAFAREAFNELRRRMPEDRLMLSSGGSNFFDLVIEDLGPLVRDDGNADLVLRSGAIFFHDHGVYARGLANMDRRGGYAKQGGAKASDSFTPALAIHAEVLSRPEAGLAICGMGMRDASFDQGLPVPLALHRDGRARTLPEPMTVEKLNDQHAFVTVDPGADLVVGDVVSFGISHPCTALDRWRWIFEAGPDGRITGAMPTFFG
ncbi:alanine racemase [Salipiger sp.]|uniref:alanine racemase n=1 Tax=Salipiger sp. TaxID=2078585 RepID=UPI003A968B97